MTAEGNLDVFGSAIQGARSEQQDSFRLRWLDEEDALLIVLADGMGGHAGGGLASKITVDGFVAAFVELRASGASLERALRAATDDANSRIAKMQQADPETSDMGATLVAAHLSRHGIAWISVGDSPLWVVRENALYRLNDDHSLRELAGGAKGVSNMLRSALNGKPIPMIDCNSDPVELNAHDVVLLASDGLFTLSDERILGVVAADGPSGSEKITDALLQKVAATEKKNQDNCTLITVSVPASWQSVAKPAEPVRPRGLLKYGLGEFIGNVMVVASGIAAVVAAYFLFVAR